MTASGFSEGKMSEVVYSGEDGETQSAGGRRGPPFPRSHVAPQNQHLNHTRFITCLCFSCHFTT